MIVNVGGIGMNTLSGLVAGAGVHWDASVLSSITKDGSDLVSQWDDLSGNNKHLVQATSTLQPIYVSNGLRNKPTIRFGVSRIEGMAVSSLSLGLTPEIFIVCNQREYVDHSLLISSYPDDRFHFGCYASDSNCTDEIGVIAGGGAFRARTGCRNGTPILVDIFFNSGAGTDLSIMQLNGLPQFRWTMANIGTWDNIAIGRNPFESIITKADFSEIIIYPSTVALNDAQRNHNIDYLNKKWGIF